MIGAHPRHLYLPGSSWLHRLPSQCKIVATVLFVVGVVATRREAIWVFAALAAVLAAIALSARLPPLVLLRRLSVELPFIVFAVFLPFLASGPRTEIGPFTVSSDGLWGAWNILAKGTLGVGASVLLTATTTVPDLIRGLERLRLPRQLVAIVMFMVRYGDVVAAEMHRMRVAHVSRCHDPRWIWQVRVVAQSAGALFVRSFERGERVYLAMLSRGYVGAMPAGDSDDHAASRRAWTTSMLLPALAATLALASWAGGS